MNTIVEKEPIVDGRLRFAYSNTRIGVYDECPKKFEFQVVKKLKPTSMPPFVLIGGAIHKFIELYFMHCWEKKVESDFDGAEPLIEKAFAQTAGLSSQYFDEMYQVCRTFVRNKKFDLDYTVGVEIQMAIDQYGEQADWFGKNVFMRGIVDYLRKHSNKVEITDWKTGFGTDYDPFQLKLYALMLSYKYPEVEQFDVYLNFIRNDIVKGETFYKDQLDGFKRQLRTVVQRIEKDYEFKPTPGVACTYCSFYDQCPAGQKEVKLIQSEEQAREAVEQIALTERRLSELKKNLRAYCSTSGPISHNGIQWGFIPTETQEVNGWGLIRLCEKQGIDWRDIVSIPKLKLKRILKDASPEIVTAINLLTDVTKDMKFKKSKVDDDES